MLCWLFIFNLDRVYSMSFLKNGWKFHISDLICMEKLTIFELKEKCYSTFGSQKRGWARFSLSSRNNGYSMSARYPGNLNTQCPPNIQVIWIFAANQTSRQFEYLLPTKHPGNLNICYLPNIQRIWQTQVKETSLLYVAHIYANMPAKHPDNLKPMWQMYNSTSHLCTDTQQMIQIH